MKTPYIRRNIGLKRSVLLLIYFCFEQSGEANGYLEDDAFPGMKSIAKSEYVSLRGTAKKQPRHDQSGDGGHAAAMQRALLINMQLCMGGIIPVA